VGRSVIGLSAFAGMTLGGFLPSLWGASSFSLASVLFGVLGGVTGVVLGAQLADS
jgi:outer membrane lipoprotein SlyB